MSSVSEPSSSSSSLEDSNPCPICLGPFLQQSYLDTCYHMFCFNCILKWSKVASGKTSHPPSSLTCPLCKRENLSIIYGYDGISFQRHYINEKDSSFFSKAHKYRLQCYYTEPGILNNTVNVTLYWKSRKYLQPNQWLQSWLKREIQALLQEENVDIIMHHILGMIDSFMKRTNQLHEMKKPETTREEFKTRVCDAARPFLAARTDRFVNELELFLASGFNIDAYDDLYIKQLGWNTSRATAESADEEHRVNSPTIPYLHVFDGDSDETE